MDADSNDHRNRDFCLGRGDLRQLQGCAEGYAGHLSDRQTVDVETATAERAERDQRAARPGEPEHKVDQWAAKT